jgi:hypothetical protein
MAPFFQLWTDAIKSLISLIGRKHGGKTFFSKHILIKSNSIRIVMLPLKFWLRRDVKDLSAIFVFAIGRTAILLQD